MLQKIQKNKLEFVTLDKESNMRMLWRREEFLRICSKKDLVEKAQDIEVTIPVKKSGDTIQLRSSVLFRQFNLGQTTR